MIVQRLKNQIYAIQAQIQEIQDNCSHPGVAVTKEPKSYGEHFYYKCYCELCDKRWEEDQ